MYPMIFDVARHKFAEGLFTLLLFAVVAVAVAGFNFSHAPVVEGCSDGAPLGVLIDDFATKHRVLALILVLPMYIAAVLRISRPTARLGMYATGTLAAVALSSIALFGVVLAPGYFRLLCVALLFAEMLGRLVYCFGPNMRAHLLFTSMLSLGTLPLVDISLLPVAVIIPVIVIVVRGTLRESIITIVGVLLPTFIYCYVMWLLGGSFALAGEEIYDALFASCRVELAGYLAMPRLVFLGVLLFLQLASLLYYTSERITLTGTARSVWALLMLLFVALVATLLLLPAASPAIIVALALTMSVMIPLFFLRAGMLLAVLAYVAMAITAVVALL